MKYVEGEKEKRREEKENIVSSWFYPLLILGIIAGSFIVIRSIYHIFGSEEKPGVVIGISVVIVGGLFAIVSILAIPPKSPKPIPTTKMIFALDSAYGQLQSTYASSGSFETVGKTITANGVAFSVSKGVGINSTQKPQSIELTVDNYSGDCVHTLIISPKSILATSKTSPNGINGSGQYITFTSDANGCETQVPSGGVWHPFTGSLATTA